MAVWLLHRTKLINGRTTVCRDDLFLFQGISTSHFMAGRMYSHDIKKIILKIK